MSVRNSIAVSLGSAVVSMAMAASGVAVLPQQARLVGGDTTTGDALGFSVAVSGSTAVAGATSHAGGGAVYVFAKKGSSWHEQAQLKGSDTAPGDAFGYAVAISGATVVVGAPHHHWGVVTGAAYIYTASGKKWVQRLEVRSMSEGASVAADGTTIAIGSANASGTGIGAVDVYVQSGSTWSHQATIKSGVLNDGFGTSLGLSGNELAVGANAGGSATGHVYVFARSGATWHRQAMLTGSDTARTDDFAQSVAINGTTIVAGSPLHANAQGAAYVFVNAKTGWSQQAKLTEASPITGDMFGWAVGISGNEAVAGAYQRGGTGAALTFLRRGTTWSHNKTELATGASIGDEVGWAVAQSATTSVVGALSSGNGAGAAYVFSG
jgi:hypothetical protein